MRRASGSAPPIDPFWAVRRPIQWHRIATKANLPQPVLYIASKRLLDMVGAFVIVIIFSPLMLFTALAIKLTSSGPVFFWQWRLGLHGQPFRMLKFRSMHAYAQDERGLIEQLNEAEGPVFKILNDPRVTRLGRFLRRSSIDELPQLFNVLLGQMSLVGPRPPIPAEAVHYSPEERCRLLVPPGMTCLWQICGRSSIPYPEWILLDLYYIEHRSFLLDLCILMQTISAVISARGAY